MSHINYRRGDHRRRGRSAYYSRFLGASGNWNRRANRKLRSATSRVLQKLRAKGFPEDELDDILFLLAREADDLWNYD